MAKIVCGVGECSHNKVGECYANLVSIAGASAREEADTCCSSFLNQTIYSELVNSTTSGQPCGCLACKVESCHHNESGGCTRDHIKVNGDNVNAYSETSCLSFDAKN